MTTGFTASVSMDPARERPFDPGRTGAIALALLLTLCTIAFAVFSVPQKYIGSPTPATQSVVRQRDGVPGNLIPSIDARDTRREIEAVAALLSKRYRISASATRGMVATAYQEGRRIDLDPLLIIAVIAVESRFNPIAESEMGAQGLMQVIPSYHQDRLEGADVEAMLDPHANIRFGARILKDYIRRGGTETAGLQRYNGSADDATSAYASKVLGVKLRLQQAVQRLRERARA